LNPSNVTVVEYDAIESASLSLTPSHTRIRIITRDVTATVVFIPAASTEKTGAWLYNGSVNVNLTNSSLVNTDRVYNGRVDVTLANASTSSYYEVWSYDGSTLLVITVAGRFDDIIYTYPGICNLHFSASSNVLFSTATRIPKTIEIIFTEVIDQKLVLTDVLTQKIKLTNVLIQKIYMKDAIKQTIYMAPTIEQELDTNIP